MNTMVMVKDKSTFTPTSEQASAAKALYAELESIGKAQAKLDGLTSTAQSHAIAFLALFTDVKDARATYVACLPRTLDKNAVAQRWLRLKTLAATGTTQSPSAKEAKERAKQANKANKPQLEVKQKKSAATYETITRNFEKQKPGGIMPSAVKLANAASALAVGESAKAVPSYTSSLKQAISTAYTSSLACSKMANIEPSTNLSFQRMHSYLVFARELTVGSESDLITRDLEAEMRALNNKFSK